jgi:hypothetical protein
MHDATTDDDIDPELWLLLMLVVAKWKKWEGTRARENEHPHILHYCVKHKQYHFF